MTESRELDQILAHIKVEKDIDGRCTIQGVQNAKKLLLQKSKEIKEASFDSGMRTGERLALYRMNSVINSLRRHSPGYSQVNTVLNEFVSRINRINS